MQGACPTETARGASRPLRAVQGRDPHDDICLRRKASARSSRCGEFASMRSPSSEFQNWMAPGRFSMSKRPPMGPVGSRSKTGSFRPSPLEVRATTTRPTTLSSGTGPQTRLARGGGGASEANGALCRGQAVAGPPVGRRRARLVFVVHQPAPPLGKEKAVLLFALLPGRQHAPRHCSDCSQQAVSAGSPWARAPRRTSPDEVLRRVAPLPVAVSDKIARVQHHRAGVSRHEADGDRQRLRRGKGVLHGRRVKPKHCDPPAQVAKEDIVGRLQRVPREERPPQAHRPLNKDCQALLRHRPACHIKPPWRAAW